MAIVFYQGASKLLLKSLQNIYLLEFTTWQSQGCLLLVEQVRSPLVPLPLAHLTSLVRVSFTCKQMATCLTGMPASNLCAKMGATLPSGCLGVFYHQCRSFLILEGWLQAQWVSPGRPEPSGVRKCNSRGLALDFLDSSYLGFRALLNLNPWTRQSSCKNIFLLHLVAWEGREGSVGLFGLAYYRVSQVCVFPLHFPNSMKRTYSKFLSLENQPVWREVGGQRWEVSEKIVKYWFSFFQAYL